MAPNLEFVVAPVVVAVVFLVYLTTVVGSSEVWLNKVTSPLSRRRSRSGQSIPSSDWTHSQVDLVPGFVSCRTYQAHEAHASELCLCPCVCALVVVPMSFPPSVTVGAPSLNAPLYSCLCFCRCSMDCRWLFRRQHCRMHRTTSGSASASAINIRQATLPPFAMNLLKIMHHRLSSGPPPGYKTTILYPPMPV